MDWLRALQRAGLLAFAMLATLFFVFPLLWIVMSSFKTQLDLFAIPPKFIFTPTLVNYFHIMQSDFRTQFLNSLIVASSSTVFSLILGSLAAYGFSRYSLRGSQFVQFWILSLRFLPAVAVMVPFFLFFNALRLRDTLLALFLAYNIFNISFTIWVMKAFFDEVPIELEEAAMLDGYSPFEVFMRVSLPLVRSGLVTTAIFCLIQSLNEFLLALTLTVRAAETAPVGLAKLQTFLGTDWGRISAAGTLFMLPVLIFTVLVRNELVRGMSFGRMK